MLGFESLFPCQRKTDHQLMVCFSFLWLWNSRFEPQCRALRGAGFAYPTRRSASSLARRRAWVFSPRANIPLILTTIRWSVVFSFGLGIVALNRSAELRKARGSHLSRRARRARSHKHRAKIFAKGEYPSYTHHLIEKIFVRKTYLRLFIHR